MFLPLAPRISKVLDHLKQFNWVSYYQMFMMDIEAVWTLKCFPCYKNVIMFEESNKVGHMIRIPILQLSYETHISRQPKVI